MGSVADLREELNRHSPGSINSAAIEDVLASCWHELVGNGEGGMEGSKLRNRMETSVWYPPNLTFDIERHGSTVNGSKYAEVQSWRIDVEARTASLIESGKRRLQANDRALKVEPLADAIGKAIISRSNDPGLKWIDDTKVKVLIANIIPATNQQTTSARRKRFWKALDQVIVQHGWTRPSVKSQFLQRNQLDSRSSSPRPV